MNLAERWFGELTGKGIRRGSFLGVEDLQRAIEEFLAAWNENPKPFVWTATIESIVEKLSRCRQTLEKIQPGGALPRTGESAAMSCPAGSGTLHWRRLRTVRGGPIIIIMSATTRVSVEEYLATTCDPDCDYIDGEILERNMGETEHGGLQAALTGWLYANRRRLGIHVFTETRVQVKPARFRVPDICVATGAKPSERILTTPPFLCIEILSPEDRMSRMQERIDDYLAMGAGFV